ncbi:hypothetical protein [Sodalis-like endosymbiont of Proechinophthirus fluctus]|nr:hypothetical protein [Sodalis-like endosymbiont of Proechinophthirus fluctus]
MKTKFNPKITIVSIVFLWSVMQIMMAWVISLMVIIIYRIILGIAEE